MLSKPESCLTQYLLVNTEIVLWVLIPKLPADDCTETGSIRNFLHLNLNPLQAQSEIVPKEIHSINVNPSSPHQLAFHLDDGW